MFYEVEIVVAEDYLCMSGLTLSDAFHDLHVWFRENPYLIPLVSKILIKREED